jgi:hypothetical protein
MWGRKDVGTAQMGTARMGPGARARSGNQVPASHTASPICHRLYTPIK